MIVGNNVMCFTYMGIGQQYERDAALLEKMIASIHLKVNHATDSPAPKSQEER